MQNDYDDGTSVYDYISVDRIDSCEFLNTDISDLLSESPFMYDPEGEADYIEYLKKNGYSWDEEECCYVNKKTGDIIIW